MSFFEDNLGLQTESSEKFEFEIVMLPLAASVERFRGWRKPFATTKHVLSLCPIIRAEKSIINRKTRSLFFDPRTVDKNKPNDTVKTTYRGCQITSPRGLTCPRKNFMKGNFVLWVSVLHALFYSAIHQ